MSFLVPCPNCGERSAYEYRFGGEYRARPNSDASDDIWIDYLYTRGNVEGVQTEWWYHRDGCGKWFLAERDTRTNTVLKTDWPENYSRE